MMRPRVRRRSAWISWGTSEEMGGSGTGPPRPSGDSLEQRQGDRRCVGACGDVRRHDEVEVGRRAEHAAAGVRFAGLGEVQQLLVDETRIRRGDVTTDLDEGLTL